MSEQNIKDAVQKTVEEILKTQKTEQVEKSMPESNPANGGKDEIKSGSPMSEEQKAAEEKKKKEEEEAKKAQASEASVAKSDDKDADDKEEKDDDKDEDDKDKEMKKKMKKSIEELASHLDAEELELIKAWREESQKEETVTKSETAPKAEESNEDLKKSITKALEDTVAPLRKALEDKDALIKGLSDKIEKMASQPAYDRRSISSLETLEKSTEGTQEISKSQVLDKMLELQLAGKGVNSRHIAEFEATRNISDPNIKELVFKELKLK